MKTFYPTIFNNNFSDFLTNFDYMFNELPARRTEHIMSTPRANIVKDETGYTIEMAAPGYSRDEFDLNIEDGKLAISVTSEDGKDYGDKVQHREYSLSSWKRSWVLPEGSSVDQITARYEAGILYVNIPNEMKRDTKRSITVE